MKKRNYLGSTLMAATALVLSGCASSPKVDADYADGYNFAHIETYAMVSINNDTYAGQPGESLTEQRINDSLRNHLSNRGMQEVAAEQADILVSYSVTSEDKTQVRSYNTGIHHHRGYYRGHHRHAWGYGTGTDIQVRQFTEGQLLIDFVNPQSNMVVWRGVGAKKLKSSPTQQERVETIDQYVDAMLAEVPGW
ncbi:hypothetical protein GCM10011369_15170 [Neiella marina]|uniref:DUF4136 domain-containing protein n=1 Tax=Neiella marina TaxID=508461 RepID=A0A8J2U485_9GAMM|nr:DUF4136 domain-containing protein [Neiella marina]GGA74295.1 hypothetical protein GCM10011369_15170 [Neiella marina]